MDFQDVWDRAKHGVVTEDEIASAEAALRSPHLLDRHLPILIVGLMRKPEPALVTLLETFLVNGRVEAERYCALSVLCSDWELWSNYRPYLIAKISPEEFEADPSVSHEALALIGQYLWQHEDQDMWRRLMYVYDAASIGGPPELAKAAYSSIHVGLYGTKETLLRKVQNEYIENDLDVIGSARSKSGLAH